MSRSRGFRSATRARHSTVPPKASASDGKVFLHAASPADSPPARRAEITRVADKFIAYVNKSVFLFLSFALVHCSLIDFTQTHTLTQLHRLELTSYLRQKLRQKNEKIIAQLNLTTRTFHQSQFAHPQGRRHKGLTINQHAEHECIGRRRGRAQGWTPAS